MIGGVFGSNEMMNTTSAGGLSKAPAQRAIAAPRDIIAIIFEIIPQDVSVPQNPIRPVGERWFAAGLSK
jgi:hypothetical protein